jgi:hypothetical protein
MATPGVIVDGKIAHAGDMPSEWHFLRYKD